MRMVMQQLFVAISLSLPEDKELLRAISDDLATRFDQSQLNEEQISKIPHDYIRQVCCLEPVEPPLEGEEIDQEEIVNTNK